MRGRSVAVGVSAGHYGVLHFMTISDILCYSPG